MKKEDKRVAHYYTSDRTYDEIIEADDLRFHHSSLRLGYVSTKLIDGIVWKYKGRFGSGYVVEKHNPRSTKYKIVEYWIKK